MKNFPAKRLTALANCKTKALEAILSMESEILTDDLANGHRDLIALYVSLIADFTNFIKWQARQAAAVGATAEELRESISLGADLSDKSAFLSSILAIVTEHIAYLKE